MKHATKLAKLYSIRKSLHLNPNETRGEETNSTYSVPKKIAAESKERKNQKTAPRP